MDDFYESDAFVYIIYIGIGLFGIAFIFFAFDFFGVEMLGIKQSDSDFKYNKIIDIVDWSFKYYPDSNPPKIVFKDDKKPSSPEHDLKWNRKIYRILKGKTGKCEIYISGTDIDEYGNESESDVYFCTIDVDELNKYKSVEFWNKNSGIKKARKDAYQKWWDSQTK